MFLRIFDLNCVNTTFRTHLCISIHKCSGVCTIHNVKVEASALEYVIATRQSYFHL